MSKRTSNDTSLGRVSGAAFPSPTAAEMAEISRIQYEMEYTEGISQRMRVPEKLKVAPPNADLEQGFQEGVSNASVIMQVPERIVVAGNNEDIPFSRPADLDLIQSTPFKPLALKTPPRVLTLSERPLDFLDLERPAPTPQNEEIRAVGRLKRERSMSENAVRQNGQLVKTDSMWHRSDSAPRNKISRFQAPISTPEYTKLEPHQRDYPRSLRNTIPMKTRGKKSVTPSPPQVRVCPPRMLPEDGANLSSARGILSLIQSSTRRAYQQILDVLDENRSVRRQNEIRCERPVLRGGSAAATSNPHHDNVRYGISNIDAMIEGTSEDMTVVDAASLRRQIIKLNRRLQLLEEENKERAKREMVMYSITVAFWLLNSWLWFRR
ncbi:mitochondrial fission factor isoform X1 [Bos indicus]|uniref:Mitochondrial fission factor n=4 Tax=Bovinae TaxID=27592 RepID=A0A6P3GVF3_BISBB|nr:mitochondrial fission factor isoform X1 [Bos taurus]XP_010835338.1 PREDICTED: mitochondrial fission factor isoform X5 [Bison bison bison]XP_027370817.1 mitochondrial fission factor isoform X1 [Bos indicus x Bos taurus]XP_061242698.1 mitochondrial fission factor isoform X1 [Bos javanicus]